MFWLAHFDQLSKVHHGDTVRSVADCAEVVRNKQIGQVSLSLKPLDQVDDLRLNRNIKRRYRFVGDYEIGLRGEGARDTNTLLLSSRELMRVAFDVPGTEADGLHDVADTIFSFGSTGHPEVFHWLRDDLSNVHSRIERGIRILEDHLQVTTLPSHVTGVKARQINIFESNLPAGDIGQAQQGSSERGFPAAGLANQTQGFSLPNVDRNSIHRFHDPPAVLRSGQALKPPASAQVKVNLEIPGR